MTVPVATLRGLQSRSPENLGRHSERGAEIRSHATTSEHIGCIRERLAISLPAVTRAVTRAVSIAARSDITGHGRQSRPIRATKTTGKAIIGHWTRRGDDAGPLSYFRERRPQPFRCLDRWPNRLPKCVAAWRLHEDHGGLPSYDNLKSRNVKKPGLESLFAQDFSGLIRGDTGMMKRKTNKSM